MKDLLLIVRSSGRIAYANDLAVSRFGDVVDRELEAVVDAATAAAVLHEACKSGWTGSLTARAKDNTTFEAAAQCIPIREGDKQSVVLAMKDIEREKAEKDALFQSQKMILLGELITGTSHELNNPLAIITGYSDLLLEDPGLPREHQEKLESIRRSALRASSIVHALVSFARKRKSERVTTQINTVITTVLRFKDYDLNTSGIEVDTDLGENLSPVLVDQNQIQHVLLNIISNAQEAVLKHTEGRKISIRTTSDGPFILVRVRDTGPGIPKEDIERLFEPFFSTKQSRNPRGLGLAIAHGIVVEHGGDIRIDSEIGRGTEVVIQLPIPGAEA